MGLAACSKDIIISPPNSPNTERGSPSPAVVRTGGSLVGRGIANPHDFHSYLKSQNIRNARQILCYARRYAHVLTSDSALWDVLQLSPNTRRHCMEALTVYAKYIGQYEQWCQMRKRYQLKWTNGNESIAEMQRFFDTNLTLESMLSKVRGMIQVLPAPMDEVVRFACITGLRSSESCESFRLLTYKWGHSIVQQQYYHPEQQCLRHYLFPDIFLRNTKKAFLSFLSTDNYQRIRNYQGLPPPWRL
jgi:hypothetical protein